MNNLELACSEVYCILEILGDSYKNKLPNKLLEVINKNRNEEFSLEITEDNYENLNLSKDAIVFISMLNLKYWEDDENEKQKLLEIYKRNDEIKQEKINRYKEKDWLKNSNQKEKTQNNQLIEEIVVAENESTALIEVKKVSFFDKIKTIIKRFFNR